MENFISIIDYIGEINNGVAILMSMKINDTIYELSYWFNEKDEYLISVDNKFLKDLKITSIYEYKNYKKLAYYIHNIVLVNKKEILNEFIK